MRRTGEESAESSRIMLGLLDAVEQDRAQSQRLLASELGIALGLVNAYLKRCVKKGLVVRETVPGDRRRYALRLTDAGREELRAIRERIPFHEDRLAQRLTAAERQQLIALLDKVGHD